MAAARAIWTVGHLHDLPEDGNRYEVLNGELLVTPAPTLPHQLILANIAEELYPYLQLNPVGKLLTLNADITAGDTTLLQPDLFVMPHEWIESEQWGHLHELLLVGEVLSKSTHRRDRGIKREAYQAAGIPNYWVIDRMQKRVEIWTPGDVEPLIATDVLRWHPAGAPTAFEMIVSDVFRGLK